MNVAQGECPGPRGNLQRAHRALAAMVGSGTHHTVQEPRQKALTLSTSARVKDRSQVADAPLRLSSLLSYLLSFW